MLKILFQFNGMQIARLASNAMLTMVPFFLNKTLIAAEF